MLVISSDADRKAIPEDVGEVLHGRLRETDTAGYIDDRRVGVLLTDTGREGAEILVESMISRIEWAGRPVSI